MSLRVVFPVNLRVTGFHSWHPMAMQGRQRIYAGPTLPSPVSFQRTSNPYIVNLVGHPSGSTSVLMGLGMFAAYTDVESAELTGNWDTRR